MSDHAIPVPACPHCGEDLPILGTFQWSQPPFIILCLYCPNLECRKTLKFALVPVAPEEGRVIEPS